MILIMGGTTEANIAARAVLDKGFKVTLSVVFDQGKELAIKTVGNDENLKIINNAKEQAQMAIILNENKYKAVIDATHPFATEVTSNIKDACNETQTPYFRLEREPVKIIDRLIYQVDSFGEAAKLAPKLGDRIILTIGIKNIAAFSNIKKDHLIVRVLKNSYQSCFDQGIKQKNIIAENGPFSIEENKEHFKIADVVISKDSGQLGGLEEKIAACKLLNIPLILIKRPKIEQNSFFNIDKLIKAAGLD